MKIELKQIPIRALYEGYSNHDEEGVVGYGGLLNIRPKYQREFIYKDKQQQAVITTIKRNFPLNVMYRIVNDDGTFEVLDGQQRTMSICEYLSGSFSLDDLAFHNLTAEEQQQILNYELMVYFCSEGSEREKLEWFKTINIAGEKLTDQELRNAVYTGSWLADAKRYFSKSNCVAYNLGEKYVSGVAIRQEYLEKTLSWISEGKIEEYMSAHQHDQNASELWQYFQSVINWVKMLFPIYRKEMKVLDWGFLYNKYKNHSFNAQELEEKIKKLILDDDVSKKSGIYEYLLTGNEKYLSIRAFSESQKRQVYEKQKGICNRCGREFQLVAMEADHITPRSEGGKTTIENCQMLCRDCNRRKSNK